MRSKASTVVCMMMFSLLAASSKRLATAFVVPRCTKSTCTRNYMQQSITHLQLAGSNNYEYSRATKDRLKGKDAKEEFSKLATKLNTPPKELKIVLTKRLADMDLALNDGSQEKAEYLDWLLSGSGRQSNSSESAAKPKKTPKTEPKRKIKHTASQSGTAEKQTFATDVSFADRPDLHPNSKRAVAVMGLTTMTEIQDKTFSAAASGRDVLGRARTGTGKT
ncbi:MAG: hypothetical protein SGARI_000625, partial [Bacillariaceae sp.]